MDGTAVFCIKTVVTKCVGCLNMDLLNDLRCRFVSECLYWFYYYSVCMRNI
jgi:hypothetical protein